MLTLYGYGYDNPSKTLKWDSYSIIVHVKIRRLTINYNGITKLRTTHGFILGATMASSVPSGSVHYPLSSHGFLFYLPLHHSHLC